MAGRIIFVAFIAIYCMLAPGGAFAQDVPGIEICTVEKTMERRTSCLQSNVDFLHKTITKLSLDHQQKIDAANRQIEGLKAAVVSLQKVVENLQAEQKKAAKQPTAWNGAWTHGRSNQRLTRQSGRSAVANEMNEQAPNADRPAEPDDIGE